MKSIKTLLAIVAGLMIGASAQARTLDQIKSSGKIIVATEGAYPPFNYYQADKLSGFEIDLAEALAKKMGVKVEWKALAFDSLLVGLGQDRWDVAMASFGITDERSKAVTFTNPQYCSGGVIVSKDPSISSAKTLAGKVVAVQIGTTYLENMKNVPGVKDVKTFPENSDAQSALMAGRVDAWVTDRFSVKAALDANPKAGMKQGDYLFVERIAGAVKKGNTPLAEALNKALVDLMADGTYKAISEKYFKEDIHCK
ncbi:MAG TPA: ABC transporter substrate-binding protein [Burkholderiaceae bacterium]|jgi:polar amino acid transport system substrate-binding protein|nr:ABC transporter substrate-binding protein [Burkholderiaceae bacterium]